MILPLLLMAEPYIGVQGGIAHIKRTMELDKSLNEKGVETDLENSKTHGLISGHIGYAYSFSKPFIGIEGYVGTHFGGDLFKPQFYCGAKGIVGMNMRSNFQIYAGIGVDFTRFKSLRINLKVPVSSEKENFGLKKLSDASDLDYHSSPCFLANIGANLFVTKNISIGADVNLLFRKTHTFPENISIIGTEAVINSSERKFDQKQNSSEKYRAIQVLFKVAYHLGDNK